MIKNRRLKPLLLCVAAIILLFTFPAAAAEKPDPERDVRLSIFYQAGDTPLTGAKFDLYLTALVDEEGKLTAAESFRSYKVKLEDESGEDWKNLAGTLEGYVRRDGIVPNATGKTDQAGWLNFNGKEDGLTGGLYLAVGYRHSQNGKTYDAVPFMVMLPSFEKETGTWNYDVGVKAKYESDSGSHDGGGDDEDEDKTVTRKVLKVWEDTGHTGERPESVTVELLCDGNVYDTVELSAENNWRYTWNSLSSEYKWSVTEDVPSGYTVSVSREGVTFVVKNTYNPGVPINDNDVPRGSRNFPESSLPTDKIGDLQVPLSVLPQTGTYWWPVPVLIACGLILILLGVIRRRAND